MARAAQTRSKAWSPEGLPWGFAFLSTAKRSVNSEPVVGQDGVDLERKAGEESGGGGGPAIGEDFEMDKAGARSMATPAFAGAGYRHSCAGGPAAAGI
jgi:hypothetical protein